MEIYINNIFQPPNTKRKWSHDNVAKSLFGIWLVICCCLIQLLPSVQANDFIQPNDTQVKPQYVQQQQVIDKYANRTIQLLSQAVTEIDQPLCDTRLNCTRHQNCINGRCGCMPNYA